MNSRRYSFEFFPPKSPAGRDALGISRRALAELGPAFCSVTYGAGGSTRANTLDTILAMRGEGLDVAPHLSFGNDDADTIHALLTQYRDAGIKRIVALRGDAPSGAGASRLVYARELVTFIRERFGDHFEVEVAAYPEIHPDAPSYEADIRFLGEKLAAGADSAITQYFYNVDAYFRFLECCAGAGIDKPIYAGVMPITNYANLARFSRSCGAEIPRWLARKLESYGEDRESLQAFGLEVVTRLCEELLAGGAPGLHFYTMNQVEPTRTIWQALRLSDR